MQPVRLVGQGSARPDGPVTASHPLDRRYAARLLLHYASWPGIRGGLASPLPVSRYPPWSAMPWSATEWIGAEAMPGSLERDVVDFDPVAIASRD